MVFNIVSKKQQKIQHHSALSISTSRLLRHINFSIHTNFAPKLVSILYNIFITLL